MKESKTIREKVNQYDSSDLVSIANVYHVTLHHKMFINFLRHFNKN